MREIKFRIPMFRDEDNLFSHFQYWGRINFMGESVYDGSSFAAPGSSHSCFAGDDEQYTEYKDTNGKQICEGDIVSFSIETPNGRDYTYSLPVQYGLASFGFFYKSLPEIEKPDCFISLAEAVSNDDDLEIVGNIHENMSLKLGRD